MAEETKEAQEAAEKKPGMLKALLLPLIIGVVCAGIGFSIPLAFPALLGVEQPEVVVADPDPTHIEFGDVVVNLNEGRMNRYLKISIKLQLRLPPEEIPVITTLVETKKPVLTSWLLGYLADMTMEDIRGAAGQNRLRREIQDQFNAVLFPENGHEVEDILFGEFNVQ